MTFDYAVFTTRNFGFVTEAEQAALRAGAVFVAGVGGMGGACLASLARAGVGRLGIADIDVFEVSNLNRQVFANLGTLGREKAAASAEAVKSINPEVELEVMGGDWVQRLPDIAARYSVIVNGCDDVAATVQLYRVARQAGVPVIDAYASPLPSVILVRPSAPRPEERLRYPTRGKAWDALSEAERRGAFLKELEYVLTHSSSAFHVDLGAAAEMAAGKRSRMSFAPMVITTGNLMAYEALQLVMGRPSRTDHRGWFFNPYKPGVERPLPAPIAAAKGLIVRRFMARMMGG
ncbi:MAG TPA: ThiF family adenylyltransferase [Caulobacteraceae bacterium]|nr:ThiF family adenylyltransferase [Caulobacteraceae bacterium]